MPKTTCLAIAVVALVGCGPEPARAPDRARDEAAEALGAQGEKVAELKRRIGEVRQTLDGDVCARLAGDAAPGPVRAEAPPAAKDAASPPAAPPADAAEAKTPAKPATTKGAGQTAAALSRAQLVERLQDTVVIVLAGQSTGSGFFIGPDLVVTNSHVVQEAPGAEVVVGGKGVGGWREGKVLARTAEGSTNTRDYAVIRVANVRVEKFLHFSEQAGELEKVVAAGFPALLLGNDMNFRAFLSGDTRAIPDLALTQGVIVVRQNGERGLMTLAHSAAISSGNSGGPLVDGCGRVLGINTFIAVAAQQGANAGFALASGDLMHYLGGKGVAYVQDEASCEE